MSSLTEKDIESPLLFNNYIETNKKIIQKESKNMIEPNSTDFTSIKNNIIICIDNSSNMKNKQQKKNVKIAPIKTPNKNIIKDFNNNYNESKKIEIKIEENKSSGSSSIFLGKKVKIVREKNSYVKNLNNNNNHNVEILKTKEQKIQNKNIIEQKIIKTNKDSNNININENLEENNNNVKNTNKYIVKYSRYVYIKNSYKISDIDEKSLLYRTEEYRSTHNYDHYEMLQKMENNLNFFFY